jgi:hypothetical protein
MLMLYVGLFTLQILSPFFWHLEMNNNIDSILLYKILQLQLGR